VKKRNEKLSMTYRVPQQREIQVIGGFFKNSGYPISVDWHACCQAQLEKKKRFQIVLPDNEQEI
jgi:hypothetical protein